MRAGGSLALIAFLLLASCGSGPTVTSSATNPASPSTQISEPSQSTPKSTQPSPSPVVAGWNAYSSSDYGYSLSYPPTWFDLGNFGVVDEHWWSNVKGIGSPMQMGADGIFVGVSSNCSYTPGGPPTLVIQANVDVGRVAAIRYVETGSSSDGTYAMAIVTVMPSAYCYRIYMYAFALKTVGTNLPDFDRMLTTIRFSIRTAPVATPRATTPPTR